MAPDGVNALAAEVRVEEIVKVPPTFVKFEPPSVL
jgi:hypothetical protein